MMPLRNEQPLLIGHIPRELFVESGKTVKSVDNLTIRWNNTPKKVFQIMKDIMINNCTYVI